MISQFRVQNYKALRDVTLDLTPIHVLIGPNDTGKTSILEAIAALCQSVDADLTIAFSGRWEGRQLVWNGEKGDSVGFYATLDDPDLSYTLRCGFADSGGDVDVRDESMVGRGVDFQLGNGRSVSSVQRFGGDDADANEEVRKWCLAVRNCVSGVRLHRWVPGLLALPVSPYSHPPFEMEPSGFGLALCLDDILGDDRARFDDLENRFCGLFPQIKQMKLRPETAFAPTGKSSADVPSLREGQGKGLYFELANGGLVPASQMSDGVLLVLAYLAILKSPTAPRVLLIEEPENGVHPKRLNDVMNILRELIAEQDHTQVILTTHSPYMLDLFKPEEVTLCTKGDDGAIRVRRLSESKVVRQQVDTFTLGEIWTAEGDEKLAEPAETDEETTS